MNKHYKNDLKIIQVISSLVEGGAERFVADLCNEQTKYATVYLISFVDVTDDMFVARSLNNEVKLITLNKKSGFDKKVVFKLFKLVRKIKPDVVHTHSGTLDYNFLNLLFTRKTKYFHTIHSDALIECRSEIFRKVRKFFYKRLGVCPVTISEAGSNSFREVYGLKNDIVIYNGRTELCRTGKFESVKREFETKYRVTQNTKVFLNVGSISSYKNQIVLADVFRRLVSEGKDVCLLIVGGYRTGFESVFEEIKQKEKENKRFFLLGVKENVADYLFNADFFCMSSIVEGMPITIIEAFSAGCATISTPAGGVANMIKNGFNGLLADGFKENDVYNLINKALMLDPEEKQNIIDNARYEYKKKYSMISCAQKYIEAYEKKLV